MGEALPASVSTEPSATYMLPEDAATLLCSFFGDEPADIRALGRYSIAARCGKPSVSDLRDAHFVSSSRRVREQKAMRTADCESLENDIYYDYHMARSA